MTDHDPIWMAYEGALCSMSPGRARPIIEYARSLRERIDGLEQQTTSSRQALILLIDQCRWLLHERSPDAWTKLAKATEHAKSILFSNWPDDAPRRELADLSKRLDDDIRSLRVASAKLPELCQPIAELQSAIYRIQEHIAR